MGFSKFIGKLFGSKQTRDIREIQPWVDKIKRVYPRYEKLSNDELRAATLEIKQKVRDFVIPEKQRIEELKATVEQTELEDREPLFNQIDKMEKSEFTAKRERRFTELFTRYAAWGLGLLALQALLGATWLRKAP